MNTCIVLAIGAALGLLTGGGIFFAKEEPYKWQIFFASILRSMLVALLTAFTLTAESAWWQGLGWGALYGFAYGLVIFLAKGGQQSKAAPFVLVVSTISGGIMGLLIAAFGF